MPGNKRIELPLYLVVLLLVALALNLVRGFDLARRRSADLQPARTSALLDLRTPTSATPEFVSSDRFVLVQLERQPGGRLALHQIFPERDIVRWVEKAPAEKDWLVLPLAGLPQGEFAFRWAEENEEATAVDPDWQQAPRVWLGSFRLTSR